MSLSQQDLNVRLQKIGCCTGEQAKLAARYYLYGSECAEEQLQKLTLLNAYLDILSCYKTQSTTETSWSYVFDLGSIKSVSIGDIFNIYINGEVIVNYVSATENICTVNTDIRTLLQANESISSVTGFCNDSGSQIKIVASCDMILPYITYTHDLGEGLYETEYLPIYTAQEGKCIIGDADNCITEAQVEVMLENIAIMCKDCFKPNGFGYY
jgi:hypothetical protein